MPDYLELPWSEDRFTTHTSSARSRHSEARGPFLLSRRSAEDWDAPEKVTATEEEAWGEEGDEKWNEEEDNWDEEEDEEWDEDDDEEDDWDEDEDDWEEDEEWAEEDEYFNEDEEDDEG